LAYSQGEYSTAQSLWEEALQLARESGADEVIREAYIGLGDTARERGRFAASSELYREALALLRRRPDLRLRRKFGPCGGLARCLDGLAKLAMARGDVMRAARLFAAADGQRHSIGLALPASESPALERSIEVVRAALGEQSFAAQWAVDRSLSLDEAIELALESL
jgi:tetratricopeptide (TPR) repeat protein